MIIKSLRELRKQRASVSCRHHDCHNPDLTNVDVDNPPVNRESDREKANTGGELPTPRKRKLDQLKQPDDVDYNSDDSAKDGGEHGESLRPLKQQSHPIPA